VYVDAASARAHITRGLFHLVAEFFIQWKNRIRHARARVVWNQD
jgi:hypothetical protein